MSLLQKLRGAFAKPPSATPIQQAAWRDSQGRSLIARGRREDHDAAEPVLLAAGLTREEATTNPDAWVLLTGTTLATSASARNFLQDLADLHASTPAETPIHHPAVFAADLAPKYADQWAVTGYPGAGNMVLQGVLGKIDALRKTRDRPDETFAWQQVHRYAQHHAEVTRLAVEDLLAEAGQTSGHTLDKLVLAPGHLGQCSVRATLTTTSSSPADDQANTTFVLNHLPYAGFLDHPYGAHSRWNPEAATFFPAFGYRRVYLAVRNPLATLCSNAAKTVRPLEQALHDPAWFQPTAAQVAEYHADAQAVLRSHPDAYRIVRYEDLIQQPRETIQQLGRDAGVELSEQHADDIWEQVGFKSLTPAGDEHLFNPTADKRPHYRPTHAEWMRDADLISAFTDHGYPVPEASEFPDRPLEQRDAPIEKRPSALYGRIDHRSMHSIRHRPLQLWIRSNEQALAEAFLATLEGSHHLRLLRALDDRFGKLHLQPRRR
ncbi:MAG: sulfotransferase domain-containing protein [Planctomycetota bacterium]